MSKSDKIPTENVIAQGEATTTETYTNSNIGSASSSADWKKSFADEKNSTGNSTSSSSLIVDGDSMTAIFGKAALVSYMALKQTGMNTDTNSVDAAGQVVISSAVNSKTPKLYVLSDLKTTLRADTDTLNTFNAAVANSFSLYNVKQNEVVIANTAVAQKDYDLLNKITPIVKNYQQIIDSLKKIQTPSVLSMDMINLINGFSTMKFNAESLQLVHTDPLRGLLGINNYQDGVQQIIDAILSMRANMEARGGKLIFDGTFINVMLSNS
ncbi:MAG: hypothetical protein WCP09_02995 [Candidatus Taylorbacteria bacterium]